MIASVSLFFFLIGPQTIAQDSRQKKELSIEEKILFPAAGCDNGTATSNFILPVRGGAKPNCLSRGRPSSLLSNSRPRVTNGTAEVGTVVVLGLSSEQVVLAADSRGGRFDLRTGNFLGITDHRCKLVRLSPTMLFAATGQAKTGTTIQSKIYYDAQLLAKAALRNFVFNASWMTQDQTLSEIASKWGWDVAFRIQRGVKAGIYEPPQTGLWLTGIFLGTDRNGDIAVAIAQLDYDKPKPMMTVPTVSLSILVPVPPKDFTWIEAFGHKETVEKYYSSKLKTIETNDEFQRIRTDQLLNPREFHPQLIQELAELARDKETHDFPNGSKQVGGRIDIARLFRRGRVEWINRKRECANWR